MSDAADDTNSPQADVPPEETSPQSALKRTMDSIIANPRAARDARSAEDKKAVGFVVIFIIVVCIGLGFVINIMSIRNGQTEAPSAPVQSPANR